MQRVTLRKQSVIKKILSSTLQKHQFHVQSKSPATVIGFRTFIEFCSNKWLFKKLQTVFLYRSKVGDRLCGQMCEVKTPRRSWLKELSQHLYTLREYYRVQCCLSYSTKKHVGTGFFILLIVIPYPQMILWILCSQLQILQTLK